MGMLFLNADQVSVRIIAACAVGMLLQAADIFRRALRAGSGGAPAVCTAALCIGPAVLRMDVLFQRTDQHLHFFPITLGCDKARIGVLMLQHLRLSADQGAFRLLRCPVSRFIRLSAALLGMGMELHFLHIADQRPLCLITGVVVDVSLGLIQVTDQGAVRVIAVLLMDMRLLLFQAADEHLLILIAGFVVDMLLDLRQRTDQVTVRVIAALIMGVYHKIGVSADQIPVLVPAVLRVLVDAQRLRRTVQDRLRSKEPCLIALAAVLMLLQSAPGRPLHGDGRKDQHICGDKHHHSGQNKHNPLPVLAPVLLIQKVRSLPLHRSIHSIPFSLKDSFL